MATEAPAPGHWVRVRTDFGWHLSLIGGNGEPILHSENYDRPETVTEALAIAIQSVMGGGDRSTAFSIAENSMLTDEDRRTGAE